MCSLSRVIASAIVGLGVSASLARAADEPQALPPRVFAHPDRIRYDGQCFTIEGKDTFIFSGAFHYFRCPKELWSDRFDKIKAAGFNAVETYVAWNVQEPTMPASVDDYSKVDMKDLDDWLSMAEAHGLYIILRPGPYICAEWDCGGFPQWLITKRPAAYPGMWLRSDEPEFVAWSKHWFHAVNQVAVKHQISKRSPGTGGIILYQLENEYGGNQPDPVEVRYLHALGQQAINDGIDVPLFTCWTAVVRGSRDPILRQVYDSPNFYPRWGVDGVAGAIADLDRRQPDAPRQTTELQGGWFGNVGARNSISKDWTSTVPDLSAAQIQNLTLFVIQKGDRVTNYYMLFGGTNFGDWAPDGITTSYDYCAPIREVGGVGDKYQAVAAIGAMLKEHGPRLARAHAVQCDAKTDQKDVTVAARLAEDGGMYLFVRTDQHAQPRKGTAIATVHEETPKPFTATYHFDYDLEPFGSKILYYMHDTDVEEKPQWLPKPLPEIKRPTEGLPSTVSLAQVLHKADSGPVKWESLPAGQTLEKMGIDDRRYVYYRTHVNIDPAKANDPLVLNITAPRRDHLLTSINGTVDASVSRSGAHQLKTLHLGDNTIDVLYENVGQPNGGRGMEEMSGISKVRVQSISDVTAGTLTDWRMVKIEASRRPGAHPDRLPEVAADAKTDAWSAVKIESDDGATQLEPGEWGVFRTSFDVPADRPTGDLAVNLSRMDDVGYVFLNGQKIGEGHDWATEFTFPATGIHNGKNTLAVLIHNVEGSGGLGAVKLVKADDVDPGIPLEIGTESAGFAGQWWNPQLDDTRWKPQAIEQPATASGLNWYRAKFELPEAKKGVWVPWVARLNISGNGYLYLNGHALGRYWAVGPQHDFFLPECWMNFGPGKSNSLVFCLRPTESQKPLAITSAQIVPVNELAEFRP